MTYIAVMKETEDGRVAKHATFATLAEAAVHLEAFVEAYPFAFTSEAPNDRPDDWRIIRGTGPGQAPILVLDPYVKLKPTVISYTDFRARFGATEDAALRAAVHADAEALDIVLGAAADGTINLESPTTAYFLDKLEAAGAIALGRKAEILTP